MIIGKHEAIKEEKLGGEGIGSAQMYHWLGGENCPNLGLLATITLEPGTTVSDHTHTGEAEIYYITQGAGEYNVNGKTVPVKAGDVTVCYDGQTHGLKNTGDGELLFHAVIVKG